MNWNEARELDVLPEEWLNLSEADLSGANLSGANLSGADLSGADLRRANLRRADLRWADLRVADLCWANLYKADLRGANLLGANLYKADLCGADLREANIDFSCWPLWCGSLEVKVDKKIAVQIMYHACALDCDDPEYVVARNAVLNFANKMHRNDAPRLR